MHGAGTGIDAVDPYAPPFLHECEEHLPDGQGGAEIPRTPAAVLRQLPATDTAARGVVGDEHVADRAAAEATSQFSTLAAARAKRGCGWFDSDDEPGCGGEAGSRGILEHSVQLCGVARRGASRRCPGFRRGRANGLHRISEPQPLAGRELDRQQPPSRLHDQAIINDHGRADRKQVLATAQRVLPDVPEQTRLARIPGQGHTIPGGEERAGCRHHGIAGGISPMLTPVASRALPPLPRIRCRAAPGTIGQCGDGTSRDVGSREDRIGGGKPLEPRGRHRRLPIFEREIGRDECCLTTGRRVEPTSRDFEHAPLIVARNRLREESFGAGSVQQFVGPPRRRRLILQEFRRLGLETAPGRRVGTTQERIAGRGEDLVADQGGIAPPFLGEEPAGLIELPLAGPVAQQRHAIVRRILDSAEFVTVITVQNLTAEPPPPADGRQHHQQRHRQ